ncbi:hypothetical protein Q5752_000794 [Cryptotrichosporon argae]
MATTAAVADAPTAVAAEAAVLPPRPADASLGSANRAPAPSPDEPPAGRLSTARAVGITGVAMAAMLLSGGGQQALSVALAIIQADLGFTESSLAWISAAFSLTNGCFLLLAGRLADVLGRKKMLLAGLAWYSVWTLVGSFMQSPAGLVVTRALAGMGSAMSIPSAIGVLASSFSGRQRAVAFACFSAGAPLGGGSGIVVGGLLAAYSSHTWRASLWVFTGLSAAAGATAWLVVPADRPTSADKRIDWIGAALVTLGLVFVQFAVSDGQGAPDGWKTGYIIALLIVGVLSIVAFFFWERHVIAQTSRPPLMRLALWTRARGKLAAVYFIGFVSWMGFVSLFYYTTLFYQQVQMTGSIGAMLRFLPTTVSGIICNIVVAKLVHRVPTQWLIVVGIAATGTANIFLAVSKRDELYWRYPFNAMWLAVLGADFLMATGMIFVSVLALPEEQSVAGALFQTLVQLGGAFGLAVTSVIEAAYQTSALARGEDSVDALLSGLHAAFYLAAGCSFAALLIAAVALRGLGTVTSAGDRTEEKESADDEGASEGGASGTASARSVDDKVET